MPDILTIKKKNVAQPVPQFAGLALPPCLGPLSKQNAKAVGEYHKNCFTFDKRLAELNDRCAAMMEQAPDLTMTKIREIGQELRTEKRKICEELVSLRWRRFSILPGLVEDFAQAAKAAKQNHERGFELAATEESVAQALTAVGVVWNDTIYTPLVTLWVFLGQVLSADHSCRAAVARLIAHRLSAGQSVCSAKTGAYCQARKRLSEKFFSSVARLVGKTLDNQVDSTWLSCLMERRSRCRTRQRIKRLILRSTTRSRGWVSRLPESVRSCRCRVERCSKWG